MEAPSHRFWFLQSAVIASLCTAATWLFSAPPVPLFHGPRLSAALTACDALQVLGLKVKAYLPNFMTAFEHFCIHTGGRGVLDGMEKQLNLSREIMQPTRDALYRFGNVSSSSIW